MSSGITFHSLIIKISLFSLQIKLRLRLILENQTLFGLPFMCSRTQMRIKEAHLKKEKWKGSEFQNGIFKEND